MNRKISDYTLKKASEHVYYEVWMFYETLNLLTKSSNQLEINILLDAFAIHTRTLFDFFYPKANLRNDDIVVFDYIQDIKTYKNNRTKRKELIFTVRKADKQVAHLTYSRNRYSRKTKPWPFVTIGKKMNVTISTFIDLLPNKFTSLNQFSNLKSILESEEKYLNGIHVA